MHNTTPDAIALIAAAMFLAGFIVIAICCCGDRGNMQVNEIDARDAADVLQVPDLPRAGQRWTVRRKAAVVEAVRGGWMPIEEACDLYGISIDEFLAWERDLDRYGVHGLRTTRYQIYGDTEKEVSVSV